MQTYTKPFPHGEIDTIQEIFRGDSADELRTQMDLRARRMGQSGYSTIRTTLDISRKNAEQMGKNLAIKSAEKNKKKKARQKAKLSKKRNKKS